MRPLVLAAVAAAVAACSGRIDDPEPWQLAPPVTGALFQQDIALVRAAAARALADIGHEVEVLDGRGREQRLAGTGEKARLLVGLEQLETGATELDLAAVGPLDEAALARFVDALEDRLGITAEPGFWRH